jgi:transcriptional regulator with XRE-family HTH domain
MTHTANKKRPPSVQAARNALRRKGWTQAEAAKVLGVTPIHLNYVLNARRESRRILMAIEILPENPSPA